MSISINIVHKDGDDLVEYVGPIDAESEVHLEQLIPKLGEKINFNFKHVESVNFIGVHISDSDITFIFETNLILGKT